MGSEQVVQESAARPGSHRQRAVLPMPAPVRRAWATASRTAAKAAKVLGVPKDAVLVASTGVIGMQLPMDRIEAGIECLAPAS